ncbi:MAG: Gfo/Idh/MocA family oxidoreductase [Nitrospira sp. CG24E]|nr:MAG: Gfo/Idh/MocA family oxidoreductase [Nitrospira sp. CG24E]
MGRLRAGVIGLGVGEKHAEALDVISECELVAVCDRNRQKRESVAARFPGVRAVEVDRDILDDQSIDLVCIASYDNDHFCQTMRAIQQGKHVFVEKPFVLHEHEAHAVRDQLAKHRGVQLSSNLILRRSPRFLDLRQRIERGEFGRLYHLEGDYNYGRIQKITEGWRGKLDFYSAVHGGGVHVADLLMWLAGDRIVEVSAVGNAVATEGSGFRNFDNVTAVVRFAGGAIGKLGVNFGCMFPHFHPVSIYGTQATFINGLDSAWLYTSRDPQAAPTRLETAYPGTHKGELIASFVQAILGQGKSDVVEEDVFASLSVCFAIERSVHSGSPVKVEYV